MLVQDSGGYMEWNISNTSEIVPVNLRKRLSYIEVPNSAI